jgi:2-dehydro-3-deoxy-D-gluconate 5-dehydrogenase
MILNQFKLDGLTALVTGCRRGIGLAMAEALAQAGADIIGVSASLDQTDEVVQERVNAAGRKFTGYRCDFADRGSLYGFLDKIRGTGRKIDILVNNAGTTHRDPAEKYPDEQWDHVLEVNLSAPFILAREFGKDMLARGRGKIIFTASLMCFQGGILIPAYTAGKAGIGGLTMALANEWAGRGVNVNAIAPGYIDTDLSAAVKADPTRSPGVLSRIPAGRWGKPEDLKGAVVFLASRASDYVHGAILVVDGGWMGR